MNDMLQILDLYSIEDTQLFHLASANNMDRTKLASPRLHWTSSILDLNCLNSSS